MSWSSSLAACGAAAQWQRALLLLQQSLCFSPVALGASLAACAKGEAWRLVKIHDMQSSLVRVFCLVYVTR